MHKCCYLLSTLSRGGWLRVKEVQYAAVFPENNTFPSAGPLVISKAERKTLRAIKPKPPGLPDAVEPRARVVVGTSSKGRVRIAAERA